MLQDVSPLKRCKNKTKNKNIVNTTSKPQKLDLCLIQRPARSVSSLVWRFPLGRRSVVLLSMAFDVHFCRIETTSRFINLFNRFVVDRLYVLIRNFGFFFPSKGKDEAAAVVACTNKQQTKKQETWVGAVKCFQNFIARCTVFVRMYTIGQVLRRLTGTHPEGNFELVLCAPPSRDQEPHLAPPKLQGSEISKPITRRLHPLTYLKLVHANHSFYAALPGFHAVKCRVLLLVGALEVEQFGLEHFFVLFIVLLAIGEGAVVTVELKTGRSVNCWLYGPCLIHETE